MVGYEKGNITTSMEDKPAIDFQRQRDVARATARRGREEVPGDGADMKQGQVRMSRRCCSARVGGLAWRGTRRRGRQTLHRQG